jgi:hypothetical protein
VAALQTVTQYNILIIKHVQFFVVQIARIVTLADDPKPEVLSKNSELNLVERVCRYHLIN